MFIILDTLIYNNSDPTVIIRHDSLNENKVKATKI